MMKLHIRRSWLGAVFLFVAALSCHADTAVGSKAYVEKDFNAAFSEFTKSADQGDVLAKRYLAIMYFQGQGTTRDDAFGTKWHMNARSLATARAI